jgi:hypothetical protein
VDPDAKDKVKTPPLDERLFDGDVLDHPPDFAPVVEGQLDPQSPTSHFLAPDRFVVAGFLHLIRPVLQAGTVKLFVFRG